jgi:alpha-L-rhamnosidase
MKNSYYLFLFLFLINICQIYAQNTDKSNPGWMWLSDIKNEIADTYGAFRGKFFLDVEADIELRLCGAAWYVVWLDGKYFFEGPDRYAADFPEYQSKTIKLSKGEHILSIEVHYEGLDTRMLKSIQPFLYCKLFRNDQEITANWKCEQLKGYQQKLFRLNGQFGWIEWLDTRELQQNWQQPEYDDSKWISPAIVQRELGPLSKSFIGNIKSLIITPKVISEGKIANVYGYEKDNPSARFFLSDLECDKLPAQGIWKRYDLGRIRLSRPKFVMDLPKDAVIEFGYSEYLVHGRVSPWINLSASDSYNIDHFVAKGGKQEFFPLSPKGGRYIEIHVFAHKEKIKFIEEIFIERSYYDKQDGEFKCNDDLLNKIWQTGIETYKACAEDALIDNPTRERGQWLGDVGIVGMQIGSAAFSDLRIIRRGLIQSAQCARADGMVAGLCPGGEAYLSSYAAQWVPACLNYWKLTGDKKLLEELYPAAEKNIAGFQKYNSDFGINNEAGWAFIDWGYVPNEGTDMGLNLHYYIALKNMVKWSEILDKKDKAKEYNLLAVSMSNTLKKWFSNCSVLNGYDWDKIGYHRTVLGILAGFISKENHKDAIEYIKKHIMNCFPNNPSAPRLSDPSANNPQLITPYFAHYTFPILIQNGGMDFVLDQYRKCWGWALEDDRNTWLEVFDTRWSHCHQWAGCPTWQLSRYVLGLHPSYDKGQNIFEFRFYPGSLNNASGIIPLPNGKKIEVSWKRDKNKIEYEIKTDAPIKISIPEDMKVSKKGLVKVDKQLKLVIEL